MAVHTDIDRLAELAGIESGYWDIFGTWHDTPPETKRRFLQSLGFPTDSPEDVRAGLLELETGPWRRGLEPVAVVEAGRPAAVALRLPERDLGRPLRWRVRLEDGEVRGGELRPDRLSPEGRAQVDGVAYAQLRLNLGLTLPEGYHALQVLTGGRELGTTLIAAPATGHAPEWMARGERRWGLACQVYSLRSARNWGMGDFGDLRTLVQQATALGAANVGVNPLHALFPEHPKRSSPYSPSTRRFLNPVYLDVTAIEEFGASETARQLAGDTPLAAEVQGLREARLVDYPAVTALKLRALREVFAAFEQLHPPGPQPDSRRALFERFCRTGGRALRDFARFETLQQRFSDQPWHQWPLAYRDAAKVDEDALGEGGQREMDFRRFLQWQAEAQLAAACGALGPEALYRDLAVAPHPDGADVWSEPELYAPGAWIGAPLDAFNPLGQNWGLPPMNPLRVRERAYAPLAEVLRANMRDAGVLRIDHAIGLQHFFWVPDGAPGTEGAYVRQPFDELLGVLALESRRNRCTLVCEDLGTVPEGFRERIAARGLLSYRVLYFERYEDGLFKRPGTYPALSLSVTGTHDMPTVRGHWEVHDVPIRERLGQLSPGHDREAALADRKREKGLLHAALSDQGLLPAPPAGGAGDGEGEAWLRELVLAVERFVARSPSRLMMANLEDLLLQAEQMNLPGTVDEYPNWRYKLTTAVEQLAADPFVQRAARKIAAERSAPLDETEK